MRDSPAASGFSLRELEDSAKVVHRYVSPTPQYCWPLLSQLLGCEAWVKHENHTPIGAFKIRGGIYYLTEQNRNAAKPSTFIAATRGNHGQSLAFAAKLFGLRLMLVVPYGNSKEKNAAMLALGAELVVHGNDFQEALEFAEELSRERGFVLIPSFDPLLVKGVSSYALELFHGMPTPQMIYVPIGLGSGICGVLAARDALGMKTSVVGVVSAGAPAYARSLAKRSPVSHPVSTRIADGLACRTPVSQALEWIRNGVERVVEVTDEEVEAAIRTYFSATHNIAEGAGAAALAAALQEKSRLNGRRIALILSGGNVDRDVFVRVLGKDSH